MRGISHADFCLFWTLCWEMGTTPRCVCLSLFFSPYKYIYIYIYIYTYIRTCIHIRTLVHKYPSCFCMYVWTHTHTHKHFHACTYISDHHFRCNQAFLRWNLLWAPEIQRQFTCGELCRPFMLSHKIAKCFCFKSSWGRNATLIHMYIYIYILN